MDLNAGLADRKSRGLLSRGPEGGFGEFLLDQQWVVRPIALKRVSGLGDR